MARILVNYIYNKAKDEFKVLDSDCVYADQRVAVLETEQVINRPLVVPINGVLTVVDRDQYEKVNKRFYLIANKEGEVKEDPHGTEVWLPRDTDVSQLRVVNGQLVKAEPKAEEPKAEEPKQEKQKAKKENKKTN